MLSLDVSRAPKNLLLGTSSFSTDDWRGAFYPEDAKPAEYLAHYATQLPTVEIDATWYAAPSRETVAGWVRKTPPGFVFSAKVPREITHEKRLEGCEAEWARFLSVMEGLGDRRGPLLLQFPYVAKGKDADEYLTGDAFRARLARFLPQLSPDWQYVVEVRNEKWVAPPLLDLLRSRGVALALIDYYTMPGPEKLARLGNPMTANFGYVRFLGNHKQMDERVAQARAAEGRDRDWDRLVVDRTDETRRWAASIREWMRAADNFYVYFNNHFAGFAPGSVALFLKMWEEMEGETSMSHDAPGVE